MLRKQLGENLSILEARKFMQKSKPKDEIQLPISTQKVINEQTELIKNSEKDLKQFVKGKILRIPETTIDILLPRKEKSFEKTIARLEKLKLEIEILKKQKNEPGSFLKNEPGSFLKN